MSLGRPPLPLVGETCEHVNEHKPRGKLCKRCYVLRWAQQNREKCRISSNKYRDKNPERWKEIKRAYRDRNRDKLRAADRKKQRKRKGVLDATDEIRFGACPICRKEVKLYLDHDHTNGKTRGWICNKCNAGIGSIGDNAESLRRALNYLEEYENKENAACAP